MKNVINIISILFLASFVNSFSLKAQNDVRMYDIFTPRNSPVTTWITQEDTYNDRLALDLYYAQQFPNANQIITYNGLSSTRTFNCLGMHG